MSTSRRNARRDSMACLTASHTTIDVQTGIDHKVDLVGVGCDIGAEHVDHVDGGGASNANRLLKSSTNIG